MNNMLGSLSRTRLARTVIVACRGWWPKIGCTGIRQLAPVAEAWQDSMSVGLFATAYPLLNRGYLLRILDPNNPIHPSQHPLDFILPVAYIREIVCRPFQLFKTFSPVIKSGPTLCRSMIPTSFQPAPRARNQQSFGLVVPIRVYLRAS